jgi:hypothetical protein
MEGFKWEQIRDKEEVVGMRGYQEADGLGRMSGNGVGEIYCVKCRIQSGRCGSNVFHHHVINSTT